MGRKASNNKTLSIRVSPGLYDEIVRMADLYSKRAGGVEISPSQVAHRAITIGLDKLKKGPDRGS